jgi:ketosteroid isomerase-like protein
MSDKNLQVVKDAYAAFGRRDIKALLGYMTDDIDWHFFGPPELPMSGHRRNQTEVAKFFEQVEQAWNFDTFEPKQFIVQDDTVVALGKYAGTAKPTGKKFGSEFAHIFTIRNGKVAKFREYTDTHNLVSAYAGSPARV